MSAQKMFNLNPGADLAAIVNLAAQNLSTQGYEVQAQPMSPTSATMVIKKDRDGFKNIIGLGVECRLTLAVINGTQLSVTIDSEWTNKIIAIAVGWFLCWIVMVTGVVGCVNQNGLPEKVSNAIMAAAASQTGYPTI